MSMADEHLLRKVHNLSDLELACLLCLISREHCLISTPPEALNELVGELQLISTRTFGLKCVTVNCHAHTTLDDFATALLFPAATNNRTSSSSTHPSPPAPRSTSPYHRNDSYFQQAPSGAGGVPGSLSPPTTALSPLTPSSPSPVVVGGGAIANVVLARGLDRAPRVVQVQALELLRTRRIFTRTAVQAAPKPFLFIAVLAAASGGRARVDAHLNDFFYMAHWHDPDDGFANLEEAAEEDGEQEGRQVGLSARPRSGPGPGSGSCAVKVTAEPLLSAADIGCLANLSQDVQVDIDVVRYQMNIVSFLRIHRGVGGGVTPAATKYLDQLMRSLAPLHRLDYVTPSLVAMAAKKVYLHRIRLVEDPSRERSMQWGSELAAVEAMLEETAPEDVIEDVLAMVAAPL